MCYSGKPLGASPFQRRVQHRQLRSEWRRSSIPRRLRRGVFIYDGVIDKVRDEVRDKVCFARFGLVGSKRTLARMAKRTLIPFGNFIPNLALEPCPVYRLWQNPLRVFLSRTESQVRAFQKWHSTGEWTRFGIRFGREVCFAGYMQVDLNRSLARRAKVTLTSPGNLTCLVPPCGRSGDGSRTLSTLRSTHGTEIGSTLVGWITLLY